MAEIIVSAENIIKDFKSQAETLHILRNLSFSIAKGETVSITGESGSGKSTLLNILGGLDQADSGKINIDGVSIEKLSESNLSAYRRSKVGFIFQFHYLLNDFSALENVMLPGYIAGMTKKNAIEKARSLLSDVNMQDRAGHLPSQLSGGERQRVAVARAMINDPALILADEPTGNLDPENSGTVAELLFSGAKKWNKTLIVVTHDKKLAARASVHYVLSGGVLEQK
ncbi:MAG: ABC transporter ATP-binding protein [Spirochaetaceae bacterium]|jgi:lipoprotein-releasing system ATP-binding protein|nr:ABC transporter ATP-binding protein [Spirochaetaceae bacterium]